MPFLLYQKSFMAPEKKLSVSRNESQRYKLTVSGDLHPIMSEHRERRLDQQVRNTIGKLLQECFRADIAEELPARLVEVLKKLDDKDWTAPTRE